MAFYQYLTKGFHGSNFCDTGYRWSQNLTFIFVKCKGANNLDQYCLQELPIFGEQSYDAWERERGGWRSGGSGSVEGKQLLWEGRQGGPGR